MIHMLLIAYCSSRPTLFYVTSTFDLTEFYTPTDKSAPELGIWKHQRSYESWLYQTLTCGKPLQLSIKVNHNSRLMHRSVKGDKCSVSFFFPCLNSNGLPSDHIKADCWAPCCNLACVHSALEEIQQNVKSNNWSMHYSWMYPWGGREEEGEGGRVGERTSACCSSLHLPSGLRV